MSERRCLSLPLEENFMDKEHIKGAADKAKGAVKDAAGGLTGDAKLQAKGKMDKAKGAVRTAVGDVKDAVKDAKK
jgi:uncharacterized protein YjbJ (UPF0337 family)